MLRRFPEPAPNRVPAAPPGRSLLWRLIVPECPGVAMPGFGIALYAPHEVAETAVGEALVRGEQTAQQMQTLRAFYCDHVLVPAAKSGTRGSPTYESDGKSIRRRHAQAQDSRFAAARIIAMLTGMNAQRRGGRMSCRLGRYRLALAAAMLVWSHASAPAQSAAEFFKSRTIRIVVGFGPGGGYDLYARLLASHLPAHIPGAPSVVVENMEGVGSVRAANYVYEAAPRDGSVIAAVNQNAPMYQLLGGAGARYHAEQASFIGSLAHSNEVLYVWHTSGITSLEQAKAREVVLGAVAITSDSYIYPTVINGLLGTKFRIATGYTTGQALNLAVERGEVMGRGGTSWASIQSSRPTWMRDKAINILVQVGPRKEDELADVPLLSDLISNDDDRRLLGVISLPLALGYSYWLPPGVPADRVAALREAFAATAADKKLLAEAATRHIVIRPQPGSALEALVRETAATPKLVIEKAGMLLGWK